MGITFYASGSYSFADGANRRGLYADLSGGVPAAAMDGLYEFGGGMPSGSMYSSYEPRVSSRLTGTSPLSLFTTYLINDQTLSVTAMIQVDEALANTNNELVIVVCEDGLHGQTNMALDLIEEDLTLASIGQSVTISGEFTVSPDWNLDNLNVISFVQNKQTNEMLQANLAINHYDATVVVETIPGAVAAAWQLVGPEDLEMNGIGGLELHLPNAGQYTITWQPVPMWTSPTSTVETLTVPVDGTITFSGAYSDGPFDLATAAVLGTNDATRDIALVDFDRDGDLDIHVVNDGEADKLLRNDGNDIYVDIATGLLADTGSGQAAAWADFGLDNTLDVCLVKDGQATVLLSGDGNGGFTAPTTMGLTGTDASRDVSWVDIDLDGGVDLYIVNDSATNQMLKAAGSADFVFFQTVSGDITDDRHGQAAVWSDFNNDRYPDCFLVNYTQDNDLFRCSDFGIGSVYQSGLLDRGTGHSAAWGDYNNDGLFDLILVNDEEEGILYRNTGSSSFAREAPAAAESMKSGREAVWSDFNNDTYLDLYVVRSNQPDLFLLGDGTGAFEAISVGIGEIAGDCQALAVGDVDLDGDLDIVLGRHDASNVILKNTMGANNHWLDVHVSCEVNNSDGIGTRLVLTADGVSQSRMITSRSGSVALSAHFGLGLATAATSLEIYWPSGLVETITNVAADQTLNLEEGQNGSTPVEDQQVPVATTLGQAHPNPFNPQTTIEFSLKRSEHVRVDVYSLDGRHVRSLVNETRSSGPHSVIWNGTDETGAAAASGSYFYRMGTDSGYLKTGRMTLVK